MKKFLLLTIKLKLRTQAYLPLGLILYRFQYLSSYLLVVAQEFIIRNKLI